MHYESIFKDYPPALPPPPLATKKRWGIAFAMRFLHVLCLATALSVLSLCAYQKLNSIFESGVLEYIKNEFLLSTDTKSLGDEVSSIAFGNTDITTTAKSIALPQIFYIPKEELIRRIEEEEASKELALSELYLCDTSNVPSGYYAIIPTDASTLEALEIKNDTSFSPNMEEIAKSELPPANITKDPLVLIVHTHGTESFSDGEHQYYSNTFNTPRSDDVSRNIVAVGKVLADELNKKGIPTLHCETMHDKNSYISAYERSAESIKEYLKKYPSIKYVFDVHRDSLIRSDLTKLRPVTLRNGKACAQIMMIVGSNEKGAGDYNWEKNLVLAAKLQQELFANTSGIARKLYLRGASYNQQYSEYGLLLEIGSCGNSLAEAKEAAKVFANAFEKTITLKKQVMGE